MKNASRILIAAAAALALSGAAYAQSAGGAGGAGGAGSSNGSTASPSNQMNRATNSYGTPGSGNSDSGAMTRKPNSGLPAANSGAPADTPAPATNNTLATPSVKSPAAGQ
ncbi:hypothetical protein [Paraburkholderia sp. SOS3]|uniref:hypothetical protein n=1 Tax=Paraburkholderia sp. SOS3 TaxID=1926494 RepID=UPI000947518A|nr:hypothetical protein [Paraburkholderia sp. SOS3]APR38468.1 hypothetical protein BTO02_23605 [Paraburkholderia sp. SOS3]